MGEAGGAGRGAEISWVDGRAALVTGGGRGLGPVAALCLAAAGADPSSYVTGQILYVDGGWLAR